MQPFHGVDLFVFRIEYKVGNSNFTSVDFLYQTILADHCKVLTFKLLVRRSFGSGLLVGMRHDLDKRQRARFPGGLAHLMDYPGSELAQRSESLAIILGDHDIVARE